MPDLISHAASAFILKNCFAQLSLLRRKYFTVVLFGVVMPDLISRSALIFSPQWFASAQFFHTPIACFFQTVIISGCFKANQRIMVFYALSLGWILHQVFDLLQTTLDPGNYYIFWPLYNNPVQLGIFWADEWRWAAIFTTIVAILTSKKIISFMKESFSRSGN
tara:strand:+ start:485 stop:976 length:492 start_codon:yes stop_codon:yes gene_type:complete